MKLAFIDSWIQKVAEGSGTAAGIGGLQRALIARGHRVARLAPPHSWPANTTMRRLLFNYHLPALLRTLRYDLVVGFDIDGVRWSGARVGTPSIMAFQPRQQLEQQACTPALVLHLLGDHAFDAGDIGRAGARTRPAYTVNVEAHH